MEILKRIFTNGYRLTGAICTALLTGYIIWISTYFNNITISYILTMGVIILIFAYILILLIPNILILSDRSN